MNPSKELVSDLANLIPAVSSVQARREYFGGNPEVFRSALRRLEGAGLVKAALFPIADPGELFRPLAVVRPGSPAPPCERIAWLGRSRWQPPSPTLVLVATAKACALYGGDGGPSIVPEHLGHEVALSEVFFRKRVDNPHFAWKLGRIRPGTGAVPDATAGGNFAYELVGQYSRPGVALRVRYAAAAGLTLELW